MAEARTNLSHLRYSHDRMDARSCHEGLCWWPSDWRCHRRFLHVHGLPEMTPIPPSYEALEREVMDLRKRVEQPNQLAGAGLCFMLPGSVTNHSHMRDAMSSAEEPWVASFRQRLEASGMSPERVDELVGWGQGIVEASRHRSLPEMVEIRKRLDKLEREAEARSRTAHYPAARPLREPTYRTLGRKTADDSGVELD